MALPFKCGKGDHGHNFREAEEDMKCQDCSYWQQQCEHPRDEGACRRHAPKPKLVLPFSAQRLLLRVGI
jgi:hypothetical protein